MRFSKVVTIVVLAVIAAGGWALAQQTPPTEPPATAPAAAPAAAPAPAQAPAPAAAATLPTVYMEAIRIQLDGKTQYAGNVTMEFTAQGGAPKLVSVNVIPKMSDKEIAQDLYKNLTLAAGPDFKIKHSGARVTIERANKKGPTCSLKITNLSIIGVSFLIDRD